MPQTLADRAPTLKWYGGLLVGVGAVCAVILPAAWLPVSGAVLLVGALMVWAAIRAQRRAARRDEPG